MTEEESFVIRQGPFSSKRPIMEDDPGPPLNQRARGSVYGLLRDSKNQKLGYLVNIEFVGREGDTQDTFVKRQITIARKLVNTGSNLTYPRIRDITQFSRGGSTTAQCDTSSGGDLGRSNATDDVVYDWELTCKNWSDGDETQKR